MLRTTCKECGKTWANKEEYEKDAGCDRGWCLLTPESIMSRRAGRQGSRPPHIKVKDVSTDVVEIVNVARRSQKIQTHRTTDKVRSTWDKDLPIMELEISDVININIFVRN